MLYMIVLKTHPLLRRSNDRNIIMIIMFFTNNSINVCLQYTTGKQ